MNIYVETNFVLELVFLQEQAKSCEQILEICTKSLATLLIPAFSILEPLDKLYRQRNVRLEIQKNLNMEIKQLSRTVGYSSKIQAIKDLELLFAQSIEEEQARFALYREKILSVATVLPLDSSVLSASATFENALNLSPQDAVVYSCVHAHLENNTGAHSCFLNRNSKDFDIPEIRNELAKFNCSIIPRFDDGLKFINSRH